MLGHLPELDILTLIILMALAAYGVMVPYEFTDGPGKIFFRIKDHFGLVPEREVVKSRLSFWGKLLFCPYCLGFWVVVALAAGSIFIPYFIFVVYAFSAYAIYLIAWMKTNE